MTITTTVTMSLLLRERELADVGLLFRLARAEPGFGQRELIPVDRIFFSIKATPSLIGGTNRGVQGVQVR